MSDGRQMTVTYQVTVTGSVTRQPGQPGHALGAFRCPRLTLAASLAVPRVRLDHHPARFFLPGYAAGGTARATSHLPVDCDICHSEPIYDRWRGSMMSQAGRDPLMWAALGVANVDAPELGRLLPALPHAQGLAGGAQPPR